jgi:hypothetical protein
VPLSDRLAARALALGATSEQPTEPAIHALRRLAAGDQAALARALAHLEHPSGRIGRTTLIAGALLRASLKQADDWSTDSVS